MKHCPDAPSFAADGPLTAAAFQAATGTTEAEMAGLRAHVDLLRKWQAKVNLVGGASLADVWRRHVFDSAQLRGLLPPSATTIVDIGSGAGFPGMVLAILLADKPATVHLVESNARKCAFLAEVNREAGAGAEIHNSRVENLRGIEADVIVARAVAPLAKLLDLGHHLLGKEGQCLFLKGKTWREELTETEKKWIIKESEIHSLSDPSGRILKLEAVTRREPS